MESQNNGTSNNATSREGKSDIYSSSGKPYNDLSFDEKDKLISILKDELNSKNLESIKSTTICVGIFLQRWSYIHGLGIVLEMKQVKRCYAI